MLDPDISMYVYPADGLHHHPRDVPIALLHTQFPLVQTANWQYLFLDVVGTLLLSTVFLVVLISSVQFINGFEAVSNHKHI